MSPIPDPTLLPAVAFARPADPALRTCPSIRRASFFARHIGASTLPSFASHRKSVFVGAFVARSALWRQNRVHLVAVPTAITPLANAVHRRFLVAVAVPSWDRYFPE